MEFDTKIEEECKKLSELLKEKNKNYGNSFFQTVKEYGEKSIPLTIEHKFNRLKHIILNGDDSLEESIFDTLTDLAGYAILSKISLECLRGK